MSALEAPEAEAPAERRCARCGAALTPDQDWCLACGEAVSTRVAPAPGWKGPIAVVAGVLALAAVALALAFVELSNDDEQAAVTPSPTASPAPTPATSIPSPTPGGVPSPTPGEPSPTPGGEPSPTPTPAPSPSPSGSIASWPAGERAWTVVLFSSPSRSEARDRARELAGSGIEVGLLRSDEFASLRAGYWVVFSGRYDSAAAAQRAAAGVSSTAADAYARLIDPR